MLQPHGLVKLGELLRGIIPVIDIPVNLLTPLSFWDIKTKL